ncbi:MAG: hypothetical protein JSS75_10365 [Bacteroidetes bacterium]|nr:hypothetical protein [Bacteroidota bacterium]
MFTRLKTEFIFVLAGIVLLAVLFIAQHQALERSGGTNYAGAIGVPLDDVYIHCRYAENLLAGHGYSFNSPQQVTADTSPLWVVLIAAGGLLTHHLDVVAVILSSLAWLMLAPGVFRVARDVFSLGKYPSLMAGIFMLLNGRALGLAASGMETSLAILLALVSAEAHIRSRDRMQPRVREAIMLGLGILTRPELMLLALVCFIDWFVLLAKRRIQFAALYSYITAFAPFAVTYIVLPLAIEGSLSYHSSIVQGFGLRFPPDFYYIVRSFSIIFEQYFYIVLFAIPLIGLATRDSQDTISDRRRTLFHRLGLPRLTPRTAVLAAFFISLPVLQSVVAPQYRHFGRYVFVLIPFACLWVAAFARNHRRQQATTVSTARDKLVGGLVLLVLLAIASPASFKWIGNYADSVSNINDQHLAVAAWVDANCTAKDVIAADDVGALGFVAKRNVIDLTGLVSPAMYPLQRDQRDVWKAARAQGANIFIIYTRLNPSFYEYAKDSLELVRSFTVRPPLVSSADTTMRIFRLKGGSYATR